MTKQEKPLEWMGSSYKDMLALPREIIQIFGFALSLAQAGEKHEAAKVLKGFGGAQPGHHPGRGGKGSQERDIADAQAMIKQLKAAVAAKYLKAKPKMQQTGQTGGKQARL